MSRLSNYRRELLIGTQYDWPYGGKTPTGREYCTVFEDYGGMPINQVNQRVNGKYPPGGSWIAWRRIKRRSSTPATHVYRPYFGLAYKGQFQIMYPYTSPIPEPAMLYGKGQLQDWTSILEGYGAEGYAAARPAKPDFTIATSLLELKDVPGMLRQSIRACINRIVEANPKLYYSYGRNAFFKKSNKTRISHTAEWYLAINFGWLPILKGIIDYMEATKKLDVSFKQLLRDEGRPIKRRRTIKNAAKRLDLDEFDTDIPVINPPTNVRPILVTQCYQNSVNSYKRKFSVEQKIEFVAKFRYWLPEGPRDFPWEQKVRSRMMGSRVTPSVAWNLMPWTFLVDYFSTLGQAVGNLGPGIEDQLYTEYCYITSREDITYYEQCRVDTIADINWSVDESSTLVYHEASRLRMRIHADPFAFRFTGIGLSLKQTAILAALAANKA